MDVLLISKLPFQLLQIKITKKNPQNMYFINPDTLTSSLTSCRIRKESRKKMFFGVRGVIYSTNGSRKGVI